MLITIIGFLIFFICIGDLFVKNIKYKLIYILVRYINDKKINNIVMLISKNKTDVNKEDIRNIVIANYLEKGYMYDPIAITIFFTILGYILENRLNIMIDVEYIMLILAFILIVIREQINYIVEQKTLLDLKKKKDKS
ncbi:hypothetical protein DW639_08090 [Megamonas funiformis]|uniref:hypothetical protein n=2 Tax=Megamonas funiformis TaxID=437897 RepID=UPI000E48AA1F|nr:hypothetical protein [Megamonas funiformis]RHG08048.1 hypothetical protein DW639_08090 [Megamonas funiformis]